MIRLIKRYGSRKLYDTEESRYVSLDEVTGWIRAGQHVRVVDNDSGDDVTNQTLTQIISHLGRAGRSPVPSEMLHELIRRGSEAVSSGVDNLQQGMGRLLQASVDRLGPVRELKQETATLRERLESLEASLRDLDAGTVPGPSGSHDDDSPGSRDTDEPASTMIEGD